MILYYGFAKHLPNSTAPIIGKFANWLRRKCAEHLLAECGALINEEQGAYFGNGKNFCCHNRIVTMHSHILMGEDVLF